MEILLLAFFINKITSSQIVMTIIKNKRCKAKNKFLE